MVDKLKSRIKDKDQELERIHKAHDLAKNALERYIVFLVQIIQIDIQLLLIDQIHVLNSAIYKTNIFDCRANKDKDNLEQKLKQSSKIQPSKAGGLGKEPPGKGTTATHNLEDLRRKNYDLEEEVIVGSQYVNYNSFVVKLCKLF